MLFKKLEATISLIFVLTVIGGCDLFNNTTDTPNDNDTTGTNATGTVTDIDGNVYKTIKIGDQEWTIENLRTTKYKDGTAIPHVTEPGEWLGTTGWRNLTAGAYCYYDNDESNKAKYGALYNWHAVNTGKLAPAGWHVPTDEEWTELKEYLIANGYNWDGSKEGNKIAKSMAAKTDWELSDDDGDIGNDLSKNNASDFSALPGGYRYDDGDFLHIGNFGSLWTATESDENFAWGRYLSSGNDYLNRYHDRKGAGQSVRLVRD